MRIQDPQMIHEYSNNESIETEKRGNEILINIVDLGSDLFYCTRWRTIIRASVEGLVVTVNSA